MPQGEQAALIDAPRNFGSGLRSPKFDIDQLINTRRRYLDALRQTTQAAAQSAASLAQKQRELYEAEDAEAYVALCVTPPSVDGS